MSFSQCVLSEEMVSMVRQGSIEEAYEAFIKVPELEQYLSLEDMKAKLSCTSLILVAEEDNKIVGFKIGYELNDEEFYSWLGGMDPNYRHLGLAQRLLELQEKMVRDKGYTSIFVKSMNQFPAMIRLLVKNHYKIKYVESFDHPEQERIHFIKSL